MKKKNFYDEHIKPNLDKIKAWESKGLSDAKIIKKLGISKGSYYKYYKKDSIKKKEAGEVQKSPVRNLFIGRKPKYKTPEEMQGLIEEYFIDCPDRRTVTTIDKKGNRHEYEEQIPTITGLSLWLGFEGRASFYDYGKKNEAFSYTIKRASSFMEKIYEEKAQSGNAGAIFLLKNFGWSDRPAEEKSESSIEWHEEKTYEGTEPKEKGKK